MPAAASSTPLDAITWGSELSDTAVTVYFVPAGETLGEYTSEGASAYEIAQFRLLYDIIESITNVTFEIVDDPEAYFQIAIDDDEIGGSLDGKMGPPGEDNEGEGIFDGQDIVRGPGGPLDPGGYDFMVIAHETMHGMGLAHPHDDGGGSEIMDGVDDAFGDYGDFDLNQGPFTVMTYNNGYFTGTPGSQPDDENRLYGYEAGPMAFDIAVLQAKYGANMTTATGSNVYELPDANVPGTKWVSIWDAGGTDEIRYSGSKDSTIDLREATLEYEPGGGGWISAADGVAGGFTIANGVEIENATGGSGDDFITGNDLDNILIGNAGDDDIGGNGGNDRIDGGLGNDIIFGGDDDDTLIGGRGADEIDGGDGDDTLDFSGATSQIYADLDRGAGYRGEARGDTYTNIQNIIGSDSDDILISSATEEGMLMGGLGDDYMRNQGADGVVLDGGDGDDRLASYGGDTTFIGGRGDDEIDGASGDDTISGGLGADEIDGGGGHDTLDFSDASGGVYADLARGAGYRGEARGDTYEDVESIIGSDFKDILISSDTVAGTLSGGLGNDTIRNQGADGVVLDGGEGNDRLASYGGETTFIGGIGDDVHTAGSGVDTFVFRSGDGNDKIKRFDATGDDCDILDLSGNDTFAGTDLATVLSFSTDVGRDMIIDDGEGGTILLCRVNTDDLSMDNFLL